MHDTDKPHKHGGFHELDSYSRGKLAMHSAPMPQHNIYNKIQKEAQEHKKIF